MRLMYRQGNEEEEELQRDLTVVQDVLNSGYFIIIDLLFWALLLTILTTPAHQSLKILLMVYISYYVSGIGLFLLLKKCFKSEKQFHTNNAEKRDRFYQ